MMQFFFFDMNRLDLIKLQRIFEFNHKQIQMIFCRFFPEDLKLFLNSNVVMFEIAYISVAVKKIFDLAPNLENFSFQYADWEDVTFILSNTKLKLNELYLRPKEFRNFQLLHDFLKRQKPNFKWMIYNDDDRDDDKIKDEMFKYFNQCDLKNHDIPHIHIQNGCRFFKWCCK